MRYSHQRESIYQEVAGSSLHPTAIMVYDALKGEMPQLSLGTVYRNLNQLSDLGRLRKIPLPDGSSRFDGNTGTHSHIVCQRCGQVADVTPPAIVSLRRAVEEETGFALLSCDVVMQGLCTHCVNPISK